MSANASTDSVPDNRSAQSRGVARVKARMAAATEGAAELGSTVRHAPERLRNARQTWHGMLARVAKLEATAKSTARDIRQLKTSVHELRRLGGRVSELVDLVTELLIVAARKDDPEFKQLLDKYFEGI